jgi:hypothetical protein
VVADPREEHDLARAQPGVARRLRREIRDWRARVTAPYAELEPPRAPAPAGEG